MSPTAAARTSQPSASSLRDRLKDPLLLRDHCYIDGAWVGTPSRPVTNPVNGVELAKVPVMSTAETTQAVEAAERRCAELRPVQAARLRAGDGRGGWSAVADGRDAQ